MKIEFTVEGQPVACPRMTQRDKWAQRPAVMRYRAWKDKAREAAGVLPPTDQIQRLAIIAIFSPPASWGKKKRAAHIGRPHRAKPDADNVLKAACDSLFTNDELIPFMSVGKLWGIAEGVDVIIEWDEVNTGETT